MKRILFHIIICTAILSIAIPGHAIDRQTLIQYASSLKGKKKAELKTAIYNLCQPRKVLEYGSGAGSTWSGFYKTDRIGTTMECINRYSTEQFYFTNSTSAISGMNIEHSFPKSWWGGESNKAYKDLFNLYPSASDANSSKSNYPMGKVTNASILDDYEKVGKSTVSGLGQITLCEPNDKWKGDFSRSYFYMATIYQNFTWSGTQALQELENDTWPTLRPWAYQLYLEWTRADKVLDVEVTRNNAIYEIQGNRNLFIDFPFLAEYVWGDSIDVDFDPYTSMTTADGDERYAHYEPSTPTEPDTPAEEDGSDYFFAETFSGCEGTGGNDDTWSGGIASNAFNDKCSDNASWSLISGYTAYSCIRLGTGSKQGSATTPVISGLTGCSFTVYFDAAAWGTDNTALNISATNCTLSTESITLAQSAWNTYSIRVTDVTGDIAITFTGSKSKGRFFLDNILIPNESIINPNKDYICGGVTHL